MQIFSAQTYLSANFYNEHPVSSQKLLNIENINLQYFVQEENWKYITQIWKLQFFAATGKYRLKENNSGPKPATDVLWEYLEDVRNICSRFNSILSSPHNVNGLGELCKSLRYFWFDGKGWMPSPKQMNFWKSSKRGWIFGKVSNSPLPLISGKSCFFL